LSAGESLMLNFFSSAEVQSLMQTYGLPMLFGVIVIESVGLPIPSETALVTAALYAGSTHRLGIAWVIGVASVAAAVGYTVGYLVGRSVGYRLLERYGSFVRLTEPRLKIGRYLFARHGGKVVFLGRFVPFLRAVAALLAGAHCMPWQRFVIVNALGAVAWASLIGGGSYLLGASMRLVAGPISLLLLAVTLGLMVVGVFYFRRHEKELELRASALPIPAGQGRPA
jgi:membrane protein DedA with SNARE-associated domain